MVVGYARTSTDGQNLKPQIDSLDTARCKRIFVDRISGHTLEMPELAHCLRTLDEGDTLIVWRLDIPSRSLRDLVNLVTGLEERGVQFLSLTESISTKRATGKLIFHFFSILAEFQHNLIRERTMIGLAKARAKGRFGGNPRKTTQTEDRQMVALWKTKQFSVSEIAEQFGVSEPTMLRRIASQKRSRRTAS